jgi:hypothetical protein
MKEKDKKEIIEKKEIRWLKRMMSSCYAYDGLSKDNTYVSKYKDILGEELFNKVYDEEHKNLRDNYKIIRNVHKDHEGLTYNSLEKIQ